MFHSRKGGIYFNLRHLIPGHRLYVIKILPPQEHALLLHFWKIAFNFNTLAVPQVRGPNLHLRGIGESAKVRCINYGFGDVFLCNRIESEYNGAGDFSGIELLAAAASMDDDIDDADKKDILPEDSSIQKNSDASSSATLSKQCQKNVSVDSLSNINVPGGNADSQENNSVTASQSLTASLEDGTVPKVDRKYWDLNTLMDAWGEPYDDSIAGDTSKDVNGGRHTGDIDHVPSNQTATTDEKPILKVEQDKSTSVAEDGVCSEPPHLKKNLLEPPSSVYSHTGGDTSKQACQKDPDDKNLIKALTCDADLKRLNQVTSWDATVGRSPFSKLYCSSGMLKAEEKNNTSSGTVAMIQDGDCSSNMSECEKTAALNGSHTRIDEVNAHNSAASESAVDVKPEDMEVSQKTSSPGINTF